MWRRTSPGLAVGLLMLTLVTVTGCTVSVQPWTKPHSMPTPLEQFNGVPNGPLPAGMIPPPRPLPPAVNNESMVQLIKQFNEADDHRRALLDQVQSLKTQIKDREDNLRKASYEVEESTKNMKRTRSDLQQWHTEMEDLRDRVKRLEDNRERLKPLIEEILHHLDRHKEPLRSPLLDRGPK